jgi:hypothetical protein
VTARSIAAAVAAGKKLTLDETTVDTTWLAADHASRRSVVCVLAEALLAWSWPSSWVVTVDAELPANADAPPHTVSAGRRYERPERDDDERTHIGNRRKGRKSGPY